MKHFITLIAISIFLIYNLPAQNIRITGRIISTEDNKALPGATINLSRLDQSVVQNVQANLKGEYEFKGLNLGEYKLTVFAFEYQVQEAIIQLKPGNNRYNFKLALIRDTLADLVVEAKAQQTFGITRLNTVDDYGIYEAKKNEVIVLDDITANKAANNPRQVFARVAGLNIWESDPAGLQLDIAARGLGPSRTSNFNTRQNGYDISADALGYPESYYTPPLQAVERIKLIRGAGSLQYGTQFGGMVNFEMKEGPKDKKFELNTEQTLGSFNFFSTFNSVGGTLGKVNYYAYYQYKTGDAWRDNSGFDQHGAYAQVSYQATEDLNISFEYTYMDYEAQQAGGLLDVDFNNGNPRASRRDRNWFAVDWNLFALLVNYNFSERTKLNIRNFGLISKRDALGSQDGRGSLQRIDRADLGGNRTLISDKFRNFGSESRLIHYYNFLNQTSVVLFGFRYYRGFTRQQQGDANDGIGPDFEFLNPDNLEGSDYDHPSRNYAFFIESTLNLTDKLSVTPGFRVEHINTLSEGSFRQRIFDGANNVVSDFNVDKDIVRRRSFALFGLGVSYKPSDHVEFYGNISENYRSITFSDLRINNNNFGIDSLLQDEKGYNAEFGSRGDVNQVINYDVSLFYLQYRNRIDFLLINTGPPSFLDQRFRTNVADSRHYGLESFVEVDFLKLIYGVDHKYGLSVFSNFAWIDAQYTNSDDNAIQGRKVAFVPEIVLRTGITFRSKNLQATYQLSYLSEQFTDATNARGPVAGAVSGIIPSYQVMDFSVNYRYKFVQIETGLNNVLNEIYFTRRAESYPGPGIIPASGRNFYLTLKGTF